MKLSWLNCVGANYLRVLEDLRVIAIEHSQRSRYAIGVAEKQRKGAQNMTKIVKLEPLDQETAIKTNDNLLCTLLTNELNILPECEGRGMCSTCHVYIKNGMESLSPLNRREKRTIEVITQAKPNSRLACQARVIGEGVVVEIPSGKYVNAIENIEALIGRRTEQDILDPLSGKVLVEAGKLISRSTISQLQDTCASVGEYLARTREA